MDLGKIVDNEQLYSLELLHPDTYEPVGVTFKIRSMNSQAAQAVQRQIIDEIYELRQSNKRLKAKDTVANDTVKPLPVLLVGIGAKTSTKVPFQILLKPMC